MRVLGIETSCDETASAILEEKNGRLKILSGVISSQIKLHALWGGVVPNLAAREHLKNIIPVITEGLKKSAVAPEKIDLIAVTAGPGLIPALLIGASAAKTLAYLWKKPLIGIHHIEGHIYANFIGNDKFQITNNKNSEIKFPILCLVVSGGHTQLVLMKKHLDYEIIGETLDDAAGEAFDKVARILGLGYPGGPAIAARAAEFRILNFEFRKKLKNSNLKIDSKFKIQNSKLASLPRPMINSKNFNFSFSGLKTAVLYLVKKNEKLIKNKLFTISVCYEFQQAVIDVLIHKTLAAAKKFHPKTIMLAGGVSANLELRQQLGEAVKKELSDTLYIIPDTCYSVDNAAMIAAAAFFRLKYKGNRNWRDNWRNLKVDANLKLT